MLLTRRARELARHLPSAAEGEDHSVHQARVASRRLRESLPVLAMGLERGRKARRKVRRVTRALGTVREMDVTMLILDELAARPGMPRAALEDVRGHVLAERDRRRRVMLTRLRKLNTAKLMRRLEEVAIEVTENDRSWRDTLATRAVRRAKRFTAGIQAAGQIYSPDRLHVVRLATKKLRYVLELAVDTGVRQAAAPVRTLKRLQATLGRLNDLNVLMTHVAAVQSNPPSKRGATQPALDALARLLEEECRHLHARYTKQVPALLALADTARTAIAPLIATSGVRRPLKSAPRTQSSQPAVRRA